MVEPSAAVTTTVTVFGPSTTALPVITATASASAGLATTVTLRVSGGKLMLSLSLTAVPFTVNSDKLVFELNGATTAKKVTDFVVTPSAAVTSTLTRLEPTTRPVRPVILTVAPASRVVATTFTDVVLEGNWMVSPSATSFPLTVNEVSATSADCPPTRTTKV